MTTAVVGAGLAGIFAARSLAHAGEEVVILEATPFIGGRTRGNREALQYGQVADLGASFIDIGQDALLQFCLENDVPLTPQMRLFPKRPGSRYSGASILLGNVVVEGKQLVREDAEQLAKEVHDALEAEPPSPSETILAWSRRVRLSPRARQLYVSQGAFNPQTRPEFVSSWHVHPGDIGRICWLLADGTDSIARTAAAGLDIRYSTPVRMVAREGRDYRLSTDEGDVLANKVVVTSSVQATRRIAFDPVLPEWKIEALLGTPLSQGGKVVAQYRNGGAIWDEAAPSFMTDHGVSMIWLKRGPEDTVVALATMTDMGDGLLQDEDAALRHVDSHIHATCGVAPDRIGGMLQDWTTEEFFGGVVNLGTGGHSRRAALGATVDGIHFAGEATGEWASAMEGAVRSGMRVADEILQKRRKGRAPQPVGV